MTLEDFSKACAIRRKHGERGGQAVWNELQKLAPEWVEPFRAGPLDCFYSTQRGAGSDLILLALEAGVLTPTPRAAGP